MPRPEQVRPRAGEEAEFGATAALQRLAGANVPAPAQRVGIPEEDALSLFDEEDEFELDDEQNEGFDEILFASATSRPDEPMEAGLSFGPGPSFIPRPLEDDQSFLRRVAREIRNSPAATGEVQTFADRLERGE